MTTIQILELLVAILGTGTLSALYKNRAEKRKLKSETANNINEMFSRLADDQRAEIEALKADYKALKADYKALKAENIQIRTCYEEMKTAYEEIKAENIQLKDILANLEKRNDEYRKQAERRKSENIQLKAKLDRLDNSVRGLH